MCARWCNFSSHYSVYLYTHQHSVSTCTALTAYTNTHMHTKVPPHIHHIHHSTWTVIVLPSGGVTTPPDSEKSSHTPGGHRGPHAQMTSALSLEEPVTAVCKLNMTNRFPASPPGRRDERRRRGRSSQVRLAFEVWGRGWEGSQVDRQQISQPLLDFLRVLREIINKNTK